MFTKFEIVSEPILTRWETCLKAIEYYQENFFGSRKLLKPFKENAKKTLCSNIIELELVELRRCYGQIVVHIERFQDKRPSIREG